MFEVPLKHFLKALSRVHTTDVYGHNKETGGQQANTTATVCDST